jgi:GT2 family glycosyltransferase
MIEVVFATRKSNEEFWSSAPLGKSLKRLKPPRKCVFRIWERNETGLSEIYNQSIYAADPRATLIFIHDDIWIDDNFFFERVLEGLNSFDIIGLAGSKVRYPNQLSWGFHTSEAGPIWKSEHTSGRVAHGLGHCGPITDWGPVPTEVVMLDGVLLAVKKEVLMRASVLFDPQFTFHLYDMDFSRAAILAGLRLGTWPISVTHESQGSFFSQSWQEMYKLYLTKWGD